MDIIITNQSDRPIYEQIMDQIKAQIMNGELKEGDALPSMRLLAKELRISIITTKRAYEELEREGYIESYTGKGSFVKGVNHEMVKESVMFEIENLMEEVLEKAALAKVPFDELVERMKLLYEEKESQSDE
ncbi:MAG: GntR family transcriptional regulator [Lachnospiraceae bacterium]|jgi:GntR family transcriptional regulator|nr:GntR family transcriptional regulator [Lachnospiraceae bacterium]MBO5325407.1 GntR family transcriptional regulator [Lachnospiraceae bacterium]MBQ3516294.1 GntR family transcriptional regulator [Lachnospiraceae bacterium]MBQ7766730.1 GntR family transcriptional regulator [Lachnospiraceae bacterium]MBQ7833935.1 GntR family transcriptional regulator [Lachnospiraceae bacterium]